MRKEYQLSVTTQGPLYPPSEVMDENGNFVVIGMVNRENNGNIDTTWGAAIVSADSQLPDFGERLPYKIVKNLKLNELGDYGNTQLYTLPLPLPCNNYGMLFAPTQRPDANNVIRERLPLHNAVPDFCSEHSRQNEFPITLKSWIKAEGLLTVDIMPNKRDAKFSFNMSGLVANSLYTVMALRERDLSPVGPTRPGPLGVPNCFVSNNSGEGKYESIMKSPFPAEGGNRIINIVVLYMSSQCSNGGAIGTFGLGGDIHAHLKLKTTSFHEFITE